MAFLIKSDWIRYWSTILMAWLWSFLICNSYIWVFEREYWTQFRMVVCSIGMIIAFCVFLHKKMNGEKMDFLLRPATALEKIGVIALGYLCFSFSFLYMSILFSFEKFYPFVVANWVFLFAFVPSLLTLIYVWCRNSASTLIVIGLFLLTGMGRIAVFTFNTIAQETGGLTQWTTIWTFVTEQRQYLFALLSVVCWIMAYRRLKRRVLR